MAPSLGDSPSWGGRLFRRDAVEAMGAAACRPEADPSILIHADPRAWEELLGRCVDAFMEGVGTWSRTSRALRSFGAPSAARIPPAE